MSDVRTEAFWARMRGILLEAERAQAAAVQVEMTKGWDSLRQKLQALAVDVEMVDGDESEPK